MADQFANVANVEITESAANTLTFQKLETGAGVFEKMAMVIHRIEYELSAATINLLVSLSDEYRISWVTSNQITDISKNNANVIDSMDFNVRNSGTPADSVNCFWPIVVNFSDLPGGGLIVPATHLYLAVEGESVASPGFARSSIYFTYKSLKGEEYWELVEATRALT